jgi:hypothetical protein
VRGAAAARLARAARRRLAHTALVRALCAAREAEVAQREAAAREASAREAARAGDAAHTSRDALDEGVGAAAGGAGAQGVSGRAEAVWSEGEAEMAPRARAPVAESGARALAALRDAAVEARAPGAVVGRVTASKVRKRVQ